MQIDVKIFESAMIYKSNDSINQVANEIINQLNVDLVLTAGYEQVIYDYVSMHACAYGKPGHAMKNKSMQENVRTIYDQIKKQLENVSDFQKAIDLMQAMYNCSPSGSYRKIENNTLLDGAVSVETGATPSSFNPQNSLTPEENDLINQLALTNPELTDKPKNSNNGVIILIFLIAVIAYLMFKGRAQ